MIAVDTNVIVRLLTLDDQGQSKKAKKLLAENKIFIPDTVLLETEWVLRFAYNFSAEVINTSLKKLLGLPNISMRDSAAVAQAFNWHKKGMDFADAFHLAQSQHCSAMATFDKKFRKTAANIQQCPLLKP